MDKETKKQLKNILFLSFLVILSICSIVSIHAVSVNDCCSVILQVDNNTTAWAFRRDSQANVILQISKARIGDKYAIVQKKLVDGYFAHVTIFENGWTVSIGGTGNGPINIKLQELGYNIIKNGTISSKDMELVLSILKTDTRYLVTDFSGLNPPHIWDIEKGMGHFVIKAPDGSYGICTTNEGQSLLRIGKLEKGEYLSVPNDPRFFREGNKTIISKEDAINKVIELDGTDEWGYNRKNIISYLIESGNHINVQVYGTYDNGNLTIDGKFKNWTSPANPDDIIFNGKFIKGISLPIVPDKIRISSLSF
jgi:hypothetical protein